MDQSQQVHDNERSELAAHIDTLVLQEQYQAALPLALEIVERTRKKCGEESSDYAENMVRLADVYRGLGKFAEAEPVYRKTIEVFSTIVGENDAKLSTSLNGLAVTLIAMQDYAAAEPLLRRALTIDVKTGGENSDEYIETLSNLGMLKFYAGQYSDAELLLRRTLEARQIKGEDCPNFALSLNNLAALYQAINDTTSAEKLFKQALQVRRDHATPLDVAQSLNNLALLYREMARYAEAEPLYQEALQIYRAHLDKGDQRLARVLNNLAGLYFCLHDFDRAEPLVQEVLAVRRTQENHTWDLSISLNNLATLYYATGKYAVAEPLYREAIAIRRRFVGECHPRLRTPVSNLAGMYVAMGRGPDALALMGEVAAIDDQLIANVFPITSESQRIAYLATLQQNLDDILFLITKYFAESSSIVSEGLDIVLRRKGIVAESLAARRDELLAGRYPIFEPKLRELRRRRSKLAQATLAGPEPGSASDTLTIRKDLLVQLEKEANEVEAELAHDLPEVSLERRLRSADRQGVAQALPEKGVLVEFVRFSARDFGAVPRGEGSTRYVAFIVRAGEPDNVRLVDLGEAESIDHMVWEFRQLISRAPTRLTRLIGYVRRDAYLNVGVKLRSRVFDPLGLRPGNNKHLFLATEGTFAWLPFEALPFENNEYLIDKYNISYLSVGRDVLRFGSVSLLPSTEAVVVADPNFDLVANEGGELPSTNPSQEQISRDNQYRGLNFRRLRQTRVEGEQISQLLGVRPLLWDSAVKSRLKESHSPRILHLATHGFFLHNQRRSPVERQSYTGDAEWSVASDARMAEPGMENSLLRSGLAFAGANTWRAGRPTPQGAGDGILNAIDLSSLDLLGTDLVVLSACETGLGTAHVWEGVFGMRRAFSLAGASTLIMSLWEVADQQTVDLMVDFYRGLHAGKSRGEALREAQLALKEHYSSPYYWGAFICQGGVGPLTI